MDKHRKRRQKIETLITLEKASCLNGRDLPRGSAFPYCLNLEGGERGWSTWREADLWVPARDRVANGNTGILATLIGFIVQPTL